MRRAFLTVAFWTAVSRALGFVRDLLMATFLGAGLVAEAFMVAFRFPNLFRHIFAEGAFSAAFTPMFTRRLQTQGLPCARKLAQEALAFLSWTLILCCLVAILAMPFLISLLAPGFDEDKKALATALGRITFPYLWAMGVVALLTGVLNGLYRFAAGAAAPILLNVCWIGALVLILPYIPNAYAGSRVLPNTGYLLAWTIAFSGLAQVLLLYVASRRAGIRLHSLALPKWTPSIKLLLTRMGPNVLTAAVLQVNLLVGTIIASVQKGAIAWLYYADRLCQLPLGLIGVTLSVVLLPKVAKQLQAGQITNARHALESGIRVSVLLSLPAAAALMVMPDTIIRTLFARGAFDEASTLATSAALAVLAFGLPAYILCRTLQAVFFAAEDTRNSLSLCERVRGSEHHLRFDALSSVWLHRDCERSGACIVGTGSRFVAFYREDAHQAEISSAAENALWRFRSNRSNDGCVVCDAAPFDGKSVCGSGGAQDSGFAGSGRCGTACIRWCDASYGDLVQA